MSRIDSNRLFYKEKKKTKPLILTIGFTIITTPTIRFLSLTTPQQALLRSSRKKTLKQTKDARCFL